MRLYDILTSDRSSVGKSLGIFREVILSESDIFRPKEDIQFVFLCGANIADNIPSKRRQILKDFSSRHLPDAKFFLAEQFFKVLQAEGHKTNWLDIENDLFEFADFVIVVLESESAFCELGAFATHVKLRKKLIVINDEEHKKSKSFINHGPIKAISELTDEKHVLYYKMDDDGKFYGDSIGEVFSELYKLISKKPKGKRERVNKYDPNKFFTKDSLRFIHDLVLFTSPISFSELSRIIKKLFSKVKEDQLKKHLALLCSTEQVIRRDDTLYVSLYAKPFFEYGPLWQPYDYYYLMASFKNMYFRYDRARIK